MTEPTIDEQVAILTERRENALMIAKNKTGEDRANWLQDAAEYAIVIKSLERLKRLDAQPVPVEPEPLDVPYTQDELLRDRQRWIDYGRILQSALQRAQEELHIVFDGPPSHESGRFVEVETADGKSVNVGRWEQRGEYWHLIIGGKK